MAPTESDNHDGTVALVVVAQAAYRYWEPLTELPEAAKSLVAALVSCGYNLELPKLVGGGTAHSVMSSLNKWLRTLPAEARLVLYWTGHGSGSSTHFLVLKNSPRPPGTPEAVPSRDLGDALARSNVEKVLLVLDTCFSGAGAQAVASDIMNELNRKTSLPGQVRWWGVLPSAHALAKAQEAVFCRTLQRVLVDSDVPSRRWGDHNQFISVSDLEVALLAELSAESGPGWQAPMPLHGGIDDRFLPNPRYCRRGPTMDVETRRLLVPEALKLAASGVEIGEPGSYFTGRERILDELTTALQPGAGVVILTGSAGAGKSAVLGQLATRSAAGVEVDAAAHVKGVNSSELAVQVARQLGAGVGVEPQLAAANLVEYVTAMPQPPVLIVDALDEAREPGGIGLLLRQVGDAGATVLVGTRRTPEGGPISPEEPRHARLRSLLGGEAQILDLDDEQDTEADIAQYVADRLLHDPRSRHLDDHARVAEIASAVAQRADGSFLYGRVVSRTLMEAAALDAKSLPAGALAAFTTDLDTRFGERRQVVNGLLRALAWAEGGGLSRDVWPRVATAVDEQDDYLDEDVAWVLENAGSHVLEGGEAGQTVYRLAHQAFADYYRVQTADVIRAQRAITAALIEKPYGR